jgi:dihydroflavonol-4-reductase
MHVLVTGGTGFVGSHTVAALVNAGHDVRLLVRSPDRVRPALDPLGVGEVDVVTGDVTDEASVRSAIEGCDAVIHGGSVYSFDSRKAAEIRRTNVAGTELVLRVASEAGLDPIVHVSSIGAILDRDGVLGPDTEPGMPQGFYYRSKADSDRVARSLQEQGAPVVITYPPGVWGPHDPYLGESTTKAIDMLKGAYRFSMKGGIVVSDVRDVARLHAAVMEPDRGPRRYMVPSVMVEMREWLDSFARMTGRNFPTTMLPTRMVLAQTRLFDTVQRVAPFRIPLDYQGAYLVSRFHSWKDWDDFRTIEEFGIPKPDPDRVFEDTVRWLYEQGHVSAKQVGRIADTSEAT